MMDNSTRPWPLGAALALLVLYAGQNLAWLVIDTTPPQSDSVYYLQGGLDFLEQLHERGPAGLAAVPSLVPHRPPLQSLCGAAVFSLFGKIPGRAVFLNALWLTAAAWLTFALGRRAGGPWIGLLAGIYWMTNPFTHEYLPQFETEVPLAVFVTASLLLLLRILNHGRTRDFLFLGALLAGGLLLKWLYAVILLAPLLIAFGYLFLNGTWRDETPPRVGFAPWCKPLLLMAVFPAVLALPWYVSYWPGLLQYQATVAASGYFTPFVDGWRDEVLFYYPLLLSLKIKAVHLLILAAGFLVSVVLAFQSPHPQVRMLLILLLAALLFPYVFFTIQYHNLAPKYLFPVQPILAVLAAMLFSGLPAWWKRILIPPLCAALLLLQAINQWGGADWGTSAGRYIKIPILKDETGLFDYRSHPPRDWRIPHRLLAGAIVAAHPADARPPKVLTLPNLEGFSAFTLSVWLQAESPKSESLGVSPYRIVLDLLYHDFLITSHGPAHREKIHRDVVDPYRYDTTLRLVRTLGDSPDWFTESHRSLGRYPYQDLEDGLELFQRSQPVQPAEAAEAIGLFADQLLEYENLWDQVAIVWQRLRDPAHIQRARAFQAALFQGDDLEYRTMRNDWLTDESPWLPYEQYVLGVLSLRRGQPDPARRRLRDLAGSDTTCALPAAKTLGAQALENGQYREAIAWYQRAWDLTLYDRDIHYHLALAYARGNQFELEQCHQALENLAARLAFRDDRPDLFLQAAKLLRTFGEPERAERYERRAARLRPDE
ncbi:MAG: glycosyltransferase family 39 protein [bacterium]